MKLETVKEEKDTVSFLKSTVSQIFKNLNLHEEHKLWEQHGSIMQTDNSFHICLPLSIDMNPETLKTHLRFIKGINITVS